MLIQKKLLKQLERHFKMKFYRYYADKEENFPLLKSLILHKIGILYEKLKGGERK